MIVNTKAGTLTHGNRGQKCIFDRGIFKSESFNYKIGHKSLRVCNGTKGVFLSRDF